MPVQITISMLGDPHIACEAALLKELRLFTFSAKHRQKCFNKAISDACPVYYIPIFHSQHSSLQIGLWLILRPHDRAQLYYPPNLFPLAFWPRFARLWTCDIYWGFSNSYTGAVRALQQVTDFLAHICNVCESSVGRMCLPEVSHTTVLPPRAPVPCVSFHFFCWRWNVDLPMWLFSSTVKVSTVFNPPLLHPLRPPWSSSAFQNELPVTESIH